MFVCIKRCESFYFKFQLIKLIEFRCHIIKLKFSFTNYFHPQVTVYHKVRTIRRNVLIARIFLLACATDIRTVGNSFLFIQAMWNSVSKVLRGNFRG